MPQVNAEAKYDDESISVRNLEASYGLFAGRLSRYILSTLSQHDLGGESVKLFVDVNCHSLVSVLCDYGSNKCFYSCQQTSELRSDEFERLMNDEDLATCPESTSSRFNEQVNATTSSTVNMNQSRAAKYEKEFLSAGLWLTTVIFLAATIAFASLSALFSLINVWYNPVRFLLGVFGLYVWNGLAVSFCCLTMIFWVSQFSIFVSNNIGITDTLRSTAHYTSKDLASLGYSFWLLLVTIVCHLINIALVYYRNYLLQREPKAPAITVNKNDSTLLVY